VVDLVRSLCIPPAPRPPPPLPPSPPPPPGTNTAKSLARKFQRAGNERAVRLYTINERAGALKGSPEPLLATGLIRALGLWLIPPVLTRFLWPLVAFKTSLSFSNLPGEMSND
jgi:hypothetical protein